MTILLWQGHCWIGKQHKQQEKTVYGACNLAKQHFEILIFFFLISNNVWEIFPLGDHQITFVTLNRFCPLNKPPFVLNGQNQAGWNPKQNLMKNACLLVYCVLRFKGTSYKRIQDTASLPVPLFLVVLHRIRIYISRYHF